jgi:hypothetical protein
MSKDSTGSKQIAAIVAREFFCPEREVTTLGMRLTSGLASFCRGLHRTMCAGEIVDRGIFHIGLETSGNPSFAVAVAVAPLSIVRVAPVLIMILSCISTTHQTWV